MSLATDVLTSVFSVVGVQATVSAFNAVENAQRRLAQAEESSTRSPSTGSANGLANAQAAAIQAAERQSILSVSVIVAGFRQVIAAAKEATEEYTAFGNAAMNLRDLTGASGGDAARQVTLFRGAGINDLQAMREMMRLSRDTMTPAGEKALGSIGVDPRSASTGIALLNEVANALNGLARGIDKAAALQDIFGPRLATNMLPFLRMSQEMRDRFMELSSVSEDNLQAVQRWQMASALLGATWEQKIVFPLIGAVLPALTQLVNMLTTVVDVFRSINQATNGLAGIGVMLGAAALGVTALIVAVEALNIRLKVMAALEAVTAAFSGQWGALAAGVGVAAIAGISLYGLNQWEQGQHKDGSPQTAHTRAMTEHTAAMREQTDTWGRLNAGGVPKGLNGFDIQQMARQSALNSIG